MERNKRRERRNRRRKQKKEDRASNVDTSSSDESNTVSSIASDDDVPFFGNDLSLESDLASSRPEEDVIDELSSSSEESTSYYPGFLDDPEMVKGRHRHVMVGDRVTGCVVSSTIHFVSPVDLKVGRLCFDVKCLFPSVFDF